MRSSITLSILVTLISVFTAWTNAVNAETFFSLETSTINEVKAKSIDREEGAVSVDLGNDFYTVPSNTTVKIPSQTTGTITTYAWTQVSGPSTASLSGATGPTLTAKNLIVDKTYGAEGRSEGYLFRLTITDADGHTDFDEVYVKLTTPSLGSGVSEYAYKNKISGWDTSPYLSYKYGLPFRIIFPNDYQSNSTKKYPLMMMIHGIAERGTDNEYQLKNGGKIHKEAVQSGKFEGFVIFPQMLENGGMPTDDEVKKMHNIVQKMIATGMVDIDRVHVHGLSAGGFGTWKMITKYPTTFASAKIMSWAEDQFRYESNLSKFIHIPLWVSQGGRDRSPSPEKTNDVVFKQRAAGADIRYLYFPGNGHNTWNSTYAKSDFFSTFMYYRKTDIHVYFDQTEFCSDDEINVRLGITNGFDGYEWYKDGALLSSGTNEIVVTEVGQYQVRFKRGTTWTELSRPVDINRDRDPTPTPDVSTNKKSPHLPSLDGSNEVTLYGPEDNDQYFWYKNDELISAAVSANLTVKDAGRYTLVVKEKDPVASTDIPDEYRVQPGRCESLPSEVIVVTTEKGPNAPKAPINLFAIAQSETSVELKFDDQATNEKAYEIYRATQSGGPYTLIDIIGANTAANPASYIDNTVQENTTYYYKIRATNDDGGSDYSNEAKSTTPKDTTPPSVPQNLKVVSSTSSTILLSWEPSTDNVGVAEYLIYQNGELIASSTDPEYTVTGLANRSIYSYYVVAKDNSGNVSSGSNQVIGASVMSGLFYTYYKDADISHASEIQTKTTQVKTGWLSNFSLDPREQEDYFAFMYEGYIDIKTSGDYTFYLQSDDGSRLFLDDELILDHGGAHGCVEKSTTIHLEAGSYPIMVDYFEKSGGECLTVRWESADAGISKQEIPDEVLKESFDYPEGPNTPSGLSASAVTYKSISLTWQDLSDNETGFEIYRSTSANGTYNIIHTVSQNVTSYTDTTLVGNKTYYYKIRAISATGVSDLSASANAKTPKTPAAPETPQNLVATATGASSIALSWEDVSSTETGFEIWRTTSSTGNGMVRIATVGAGQTSYDDLELPGNTTLYYQIRAVGDGGNSAFTSIVNATTKNSKPELLEILSRTVKLGTTQSFKIFAKDDDVNDVLTFTVTGLPTFGTFTDNEDRSGTFSFSPTTADGGTYDIEVTVTDVFGDTASETFTITVNNNNTPAISAIENQSVEQGMTKTFNVSSTDTEGNASLKLSLANNPEFVTIQDLGNGSGVISLTPDINEMAGKYADVQLIVQDDQGGVGTYTFDVTVIGVDKEFTLNINFSHGDKAGFPWNNTGNAASANNQLAGITDDEGKSTGVSLTFRGTADPQWSSTRSDVSSSLYVPNVTESRYYSDGSKITMTMEGLNPQLNYNFTFFGSSNESGGNGKTRKTKFKIGAKEGTIETLNNTSSTVNLNNIVSDASGKVTIEVSKASTADYRMSLNSLVIEGFYDNGDAPIKPSQLTAKALTPSEIKLNWLDNARSEEGYKIYRSTSSAGPFEVIATTQSNVTTYLDETVVGRTTYFYKVQAYNDNGDSEESNVVTVITPNSAPEMTMQKYISVVVGENKSVAILATDAESDPINFSSKGLPPFAYIVDNGNGTAYLKLIPGSNDQAGSYVSHVYAIDDRMDSVSTEIIISVSSNQYDESIYMNFSTEDVAGTPWNNITISPTNTTKKVSNLLSAGGLQTSVSLSPVSGWKASSQNGSTTGNNTGVYPDAVIKSNWNADNNASLRLDGLSSNKTYNLVIFASSDTIADGTTIYTVNGNSVSLNAALNTEKTVRLNGLAADENGALILTLSKGSVSFGNYISALILETYDGGVLAEPSNLKAQPVSTTSIKLGWSDNASNESGYFIYRSESQNGTFAKIGTVGANIASFTDTDLTENTSYYYKISASNDGGESAFSNISVGTTYAYMIYINMVGDKERYEFPALPWNNTKVLFSEGVVVGSLKDSKGVSRSEQIEVVEWPGNAADNNLGYTTGNNSGAVPDAVMKTFYFLESNTSSKFEIQNLNTEYEYDFHFFGSGDPNNGLFQSKPNLTTDYKIGNTTVSQNGLGNTSEFVIINGVEPDQYGKATLSIESHVYNENYASEYGIFNAVLLGAYTAPEVILDLTPPTVPTDLVTEEIAPESITLGWQPSTDDSGVVAYYEIYNHDKLISKVPGNVTSTTIENTIAGISYDFTVLAIDEAGNKSAHSENLEFTYDIFNEINYTYYEGEWTSMPDYLKTEEKKSGYIDNFDLSPKERDQDFGFRFNGYLKIDEPGNYTFFTESNTGSKLYIDHNEVVSNDFADNSTAKSGTVNNMEEGYYHILLDYRNEDESDLLKVYYQKAGGSKILIPSEKLYRTDTVPEVVQPVTFLEVKAEYQYGQVLVSWRTASEVDNEKFIIEKSYDLDTFVPVSEVQGAGNSTEIRHYSYSDKDLKAGMVYYRIRQVDYSGNESYSTVVSAAVIQEVETVYAVKVFPNPAEGGLVNFMVTSSDYDTSVSIDVLDLSGRLVMQYATTIIGNPEMLDVSSRVKNGTYILRFTQGNNMIHQRVIFK